MKTLIIDNYDSFTFNLVQLLQKAGSEVIVEKNDSISISKLKKVNPDKLLISPGPGTPETAGNCSEIIKYCKTKLSILGVCLGMQIIAKFFGGEIITAKHLLHGKVSRISHDEKSIFSDIQQDFKACRYHSLEVRKRNFPKTLQISATADDGTIMGIRHKQFKIEGVQFHPEAILTENGEKLIKNWLSLK